MTTKNINFIDGYSSEEIPAEEITQGPQGIQGEQGIQGIQGIQGEQGPQGEPGVDGLDAINYDDMSKVLSEKEAGIYKIVEWKDSGDNLRKRSTLSGGTAPLFTTRTVQFYDTDGVTLLSTLTYAISYDVDDEFLSEELV